MYFEIHRSTDQQYYFTAATANNEVVLQSETYTRKASAQHAIDVIKAGAGNARVIDRT